MGEMQLQIERNTFGGKVICGEAIDVWELQQQQQRNDSKTKRS